MTHHPQRRSASGETAKVHEIEVLALTKTADESICRRRTCCLKCHQSLQTKDGIVKVTAAHPVLKPSLFRHLAQEERLHQIDGLTQELGSESGDLQHFKPYAHVPVMTGTEQSRESENPERPRPPSFVIRHSSLPWGKPLELLQPRWHARPR